MTTRPPRLARWLLGVATEDAERSWVLDDLEELYCARRAERGRVRADWWYWSQVVRSAPRLLARRMEPGRGPRHALDRDSGTGDGGERLAAAAHALRVAFRRLAHEPGFSVAAVSTLALGIGGAVAVFALVEAVLLRPLPYPDADRLVILNHRDQRTGITKEFVAIGDYTDLMARQSSFDVIGAYGYGGQLSVTSAPEPYRATAFAATPGALAALGFRPAFGRGIEAADIRPNGPLIVVLGHQLWEDKFGGDRRVIGTSISLNNIPRTIVGIAPRDFRFRDLRPADVILPDIVPAQAPAQRKSNWAFMVAHIRPGRTLADAQADLARISQQMEREFPQSNIGSMYFASPLREVLAGNTTKPLFLLLAAVGLVMLIACANVANLLLVRALARRREIAVRLALGVARGRLAMQLLSESFALALVAGVCGMGIGQWGSKALVALVPASVQAPGLADVHLNGAVLAFALAITLLTTLTFGLVAMASVRADSPASALTAAGRTSGGRTMRRVASGLVVFEVTLAIMLLMGAGLITRTFASLLSVDPGFRYDHVMTISTALPADRYRDSLAREGFYRGAFAALRAVPGVQDAGTAAVTPLTGNNWTVGLERADRPLAAGERPPEVGWQAASGGYFRTLGIPLLAGRLFDQRDRQDGPPVVIVSQAIQRRFFANENAVGKQLKMGRGTAEVVGVVGDIRRAGLRDDPRADLYFPEEQSPSTQTTFFIRTAGDPARSARALEGAIQSVESRTMILHAQTLGDVAAESVRTTTLTLWLLGGFAVTALLLAAIGIYGVMSYVVRQRTREIGTRIALGATSRDIIGLIMREGAVIAIAGAVLGALGAVAAARPLASMLYGVRPFDPATMGVATVVLLASNLAACYVPARHAAAVDPVRTLSEP